MFGRERRNAQAIEAMSAKLATADARSRSLSRAIAQIELRVAQEGAARERLQATTERVIATVEDSTLSNTSDVARALGQVAGLCAAVAQRLEADQIERRALTEVLAQLAQSSTSRLDAPAHTIGGTVFASPVTQEREISIVVDDPAVAALGGEASDDVRVVLECLTEAVYRQNTRDSRV
jgi:hypothetical protein